MKRVCISALAILLATAAVQAQTDTTKSPQREQHKMQKESPYARLNLTAEQQAKMKTLRDEFKQKREALKNEKLTEAERRSQVQTLHEQQKTATDAILTPAQKEELEKMKTERKDRVRGKKRSMHRDSSVTRNGRANWQGHNAKGSMALQKELNLTIEQQAKMKALRADFKSKSETVRNDQVLTQEQKREKLRELMKQQQEQMKTVLTKDQQEKLQSLRQERAARNTK